eukprot:UN5162
MPNCYTIIDIKYAIFATNSSTICTRMAILILRHYCHKYSL